MNAEKQLDILKKSLSLFFNHPIKIFQHDGAPAHYTVGAALYNSLKGKGLGRRGSIEANEECFKQNIK